MVTHGRKREVGREGKDTRQGASTHTQTDADKTKGVTAEESEKGRQRNIRIYIHIKKT